MAPITVLATTTTTTTVVSLVMTVVVVALVTMMVLVVKLRQHAPCGGVHQMTLVVVMSHQQLPCVGTCASPFACAQPLVAPAAQCTLSPAPPCVSVSRALAWYRPCLLSVLAAAWSPVGTRQWRVRCVVGAQCRRVHVSCPALPPAVLDFWRSPSQWRRRRRWRYPAGHCTHRWRLHRHDGVCGPTWTRDQSVQTQQCLHTCRPGAQKWETVHVLQWVCDKIVVTTVVA